MATNNSEQPSAQQIKDFVEAKNNLLKNVTQSTKKTVPTIDKEQLKTFMQNIYGNESNLRNTARYLFYRSNIFYRIVHFYAGMWDLRCRKINPIYSIGGDNDKDKMIKSFSDAAVWLDRMNIQNNMVEILLNVYVQDVCYAVTYLDETGMYFYTLDPDECVIDSRYSDGGFGFAVDMSKWRNTRRQELIEMMGSPFREMYDEYQKTGSKWQHCPDEYAACFKFRTDVWDAVVPPLLPIYLQLASLEDLVDIQAEDDALSIYKLVYMPLHTRSNAKSLNEWEVDPAIAHQYFSRLLKEALPENVAGGVVPAKELKTIDFQKSVDEDVTRVEKASNQVLQTAGGGAVINSNNISSIASFNAWLKSESQFAMDTLIGQINGFVNRMLYFKLGKDAAKVEFFNVSIYTKEEFRKAMLESCQYGYSNKIAYNTLLGFSELDTLGQIYFEEEVLGLHDIMKYPLSSSHTQSSGAPTKDDDEITDAGEDSRNQ